MALKPKHSDRIASYLEKFRPSSLDWVCIKPINQLMGSENREKSEDVMCSKEEKQSMRMEENVETSHPFRLVFKNLMNQIDRSTPDYSKIRREPLLCSENEIKIPRKIRSAYSHVSEESLKNDPKPLDLSSLNSLAHVACKELSKLESQKKSKKRVRDEKGKGKGKEEEGIRIKLEPMKKKHRHCSVFTPPLGLLNKVKDMGGYELKLVMEKDLTESDINKGHSRLSIPKSIIHNPFLTKEEEFLLGKSIDTEELGWLDVLVLDPTLKEIELRLKKWNMNSNCIYNLIKKWNLLVNDNKLKKGDTMQLWSFRINPVCIGTGLCFGLIKLGKEKEDRVSYDRSIAGSSSMA